MTNTIQQLEDLKEWSKDSTRYERRLAFRGGQLVQPGPGRQGYQGTKTKAEIDAMVSTRDERRKLYKENNLTVEGKPLTRKRPIVIDDDILKQFDDLIKETDLDLKAIGEKLGWKPTKKGQGGNLKPDSLLVKEYEKKYGTISESRFKPHTLTLDSPQVKEVLKLQEEGMSTRQNY